MAMEYFCCYHSYKRRCEKLTDEELGRLFRALLAYSESGVSPLLEGREAIAFDFVADDIDRAKASYAEKCRQNAENGKLGGRPRKEKTEGFSEKPDETEKTQRESKSKRESKRESKSKSESKGVSLQPLPRPEWAGERLQDAFSQWVAYKAERREPYGTVGLQNLEDTLRENAARYGESAVAALIRECMASGWHGIIFDRLAQPGRMAPVSTEPTQWAKDIVARQMREANKEA